MKIKTRQGVFETNSSSIHTLNIFRNSTCVIPDYIKLERQEFGWDFKTYFFHDSKVNYLFEICIAYDEYNNKLKIDNDKMQIIGYKEGGCVDKLVKALISFGCSVSVSFGEDIYRGYIDHVEDAFDILDDLLNDYELLKKFLFCIDSYVSTGNDNTYDDEDTGLLYAANNVDFICYQKGN